MLLLLFDVDNDDKCSHDAAYALCPGSAIATTPSTPLEHLLVNTAYSITTRRCLRRHRRIAHHRVLPDASGTRRFGRKSNHPQVETNNIPIRDLGATEVKLDAKPLAQELREALEDADGDKEEVSIDPEVLHVHGYSENDYHPGAPPRPCCTGCLSRVMRVRH